VKRLKERVNISDKLKINVKSALKNAEGRIEKDNDLTELMRKIMSKQDVNANELEKNQKKDLDKLVDYGMISRLLNDEVEISGLGWHVLRRHFREI
jgi:uncharacterized protein YfkK (UPF0435 family)